MNVICVCVQVLESCKRLITDLHMLSVPIRCVLGGFLYLCISVTVPVYLSVLNNNNCASFILQSLYWFFFISVELFDAVFPKD